LHAAERLDRLITLACIRQFFDAEMPNTVIGGRDPRTSVSLGMQSWRGVLVENEDRALLLDVTVARFNELLGDDLLAGGWQDLDAGVVREALEHISRWRPTPSCGGDALGELLQAVRGPGNGAGDFYTPYNACLLMASLNPVKPGETVLDPCCGSGRMLLAAVEVCRKLHGHDQVPNLVAVDTDGTAVRVARLNMVLAGLDSSYGPHYSAPVSAAAPS
jgi:ribosomal protein L11 methylase PrmA